MASYVRCAWGKAAPVSADAVWNLQGKTQAASD